MIHVVIPESCSCRLPFFLAAEEWVARNLPENEYFFAWRVKPTVICGRHQEIDKEVDLEYCKVHGIDVVRRRSGGGAVFADMNNWMFSYITPGDAITTTFEHYTSMMVEMLRSMGFAAEATGRNDILVNGSKVAGNAFYHLPGRCIVHGTMLLEIDTEHISHAITPSRGKLESKGVKSVASRVTSLRACGLEMDVADFRQSVIGALCQDEYVLTGEALAEIRELEQRYYDPEFLFPKKQSGRAQHTRIDGVGTICIRKRTDSSNCLTELGITGDFFADSEALDNLKAHLLGTLLTPESIHKRLSQFKLGEAIPGLTTETLVELLKN